MAESEDKLASYRAKRDFRITAEPAEGGTPSADALTFVVQKHWASRLHYDFRLELDGTMLSWAVPKGPSFDPQDKRMAVQVEDHPISYSSFEGMIPAGQYGAGKVIVWDNGSWHPVGDPHQGLRDGNLKFELRGHKLTGRWALIRMKSRGERQQPWLLIKEKDAHARPATAFSVVDEWPDSVTGQEKSTDRRIDGPRPAGASAGPTTASKESPARKAARSAKAAASADADAEAAAAASGGPASEAAASAKAPGRRKRAAVAGAASGAHSAAQPPPHPKATPAALPASLAPQLATLVEAPPADHGDWVFEVKFDGYRLLARVDGADIRLFTRNGNDWTDRLPALHRALKAMALPSGWYDGEIIVHGEHGLPDFGALQNAFDAQSTAAIVYCLFDVPYLDGHDLRAVPLEDRRALLQGLVAGSPSPLVRFSEAFDAPAQSIVASACKLGLEGIIGKRRGSRYRSARSADWIKIKCSQRQEFVIGGWTDPQGSRTGFGALLLGVHDAGGALRYAGNVGTGFDQKALRELRGRLDENAATDCPFAKPGEITGRPHWVAPKLVAEVGFGEWTRAGRIRHAVFHALRTDKPAGEIVREKPAPAPEPGAARSSGKGSAVADAPRPAPLRHALSSKLRVTHPDRVIDPGSGTTKIELVRYYGLVGELMMAHLKGRPISLVRAPAGVGGELFFQKHAETEKLPGLRQLDPALDPGHPAMLEVATKDGLLSAAQWNVVEVHTMNATAKSFDQPDRLVFDLDPGEGVAWSSMQQAAEVMHGFLGQLGLPAFLKTSGGKGLHVVVPIRKQYGWDDAKAFSQAVVRHVAQTIPQLFVAKSGPKNRVGKVFVDYLRNGQGATTVCAWSARARPGLGISVPVDWSELGTLRGGDHWSVRSVQSRLDRGNAPWDGYARAAKSLTAAMKTLGFEPGAA